MQVSSEKGQAHKEKGMMKMITILATWKFAVKLA